MALTATQQARLDAIDEILAAGVTSADVEGIRVQYDLPALRRERDELRSIAYIGKVGSRFRRVIFSGS